MEKPVKVGYVWRSKMNGGVYSPEGISPCLVCGCHSGVEPKIIIYGDKKKKQVILNTCADGTAKAVLSGYYKFYAATLFMWGGTAGTCVAEVYDDDSD